MLKLCMNGDFSTSWCVTLACNAGGRQQRDPVRGLKDRDHKRGREQRGAVWCIFGYSGVKALQCLHLKVTGALQASSLLTEH